MQICIKLLDYFHSPGCFLAKVQEIVVPWAGRTVCYDSFMSIYVKFSMNGHVMPHEFS